MPKAKATYIIDCDANEPSGYGSIFLELSSKQRLSVGTIYYGTSGSGKSVEIEITMLDLGEAVNSMIKDAVKRKFERFFYVKGVKLHAISLEEIRKELGRNKR